MGDMLARGDEWLQRQRQAHMTRTVLYSRGPDTIAVRAAVTRSRVEMPDDSGIVRIVETRDYIIASDDLVIRGERVTPQLGDVVRETFAGRPARYAVLNGENESGWSWQGRDRNAIRVRTKLVS